MTAAVHPAHFPLPGEMTIYTASETCKALRAWLDACDGTVTTPLTVNGAGVHELDGAGLQLLMGLDHSCVARRLSWQLAEPSSTLQKACARMGIDWLPLSAATEGARA